MTKSGFLAALATSVCIVAVATPAAAQTREYNIPAGSLKAALDAYARQSGRQIIYKADDVRGVHSRGAQGNLSADDALKAILAGTGFSFQADSSGAIAIVAGESQAGDAAAESKGSDIVVTGSRIRGAKPTSPVIVISQKEMREAGFSNLGEVARSLPQSFGGGQNPGVSGPGLGNSDVNGGSSLNLRGLGQDATLTLLNGHRLSYNGVYQAIDISAIPFAAVDRLEIVADGASALYGSDAVGGVANVILKRDYSGLYTSVRLGGSTDGGNFQQQYSAVGGTTWSSGGVIAAVDYNHVTAVSAGQRDYASNLNSTATLMPRLDSVFGLISAHQTITEGVTFSVDAMGGRRKKRNDSSFSPTLRFDESGSSSEPSDTSFVIAPSIAVDLPSNWRGSVQAVYAEDNTKLYSRNFSNSQVSLYSIGRYNNSVLNFEANADGPIFQLPGGSAKLSVGGGYRRSGLDANLTFDYIAFQIVSTSFSKSRESYYGFAEVALPFISEQQGISGIRSLTASGAVRYENYPGLDNLLTPRLGLSYEPFRGLELKSSWGRSFKAPTLAQSYNYTTAYIDPASFYSSTTLPASTPVMNLDGGNPQLKAERAETWSVSAQLKPAFAPGFEAEISYFHVAYDNRVVLPIAIYTGALENPAYANLVTLNPSVAAVNAAADLASGRITNDTADPYDPAAIGAIIDGRWQNALRETVSGVDMNLRYSLELTSGNSITVSGNATYLKSSSSLTGAVSTDLAGQVYNPPHWRARGGVTWNRNDITWSLFANYTGSLRNVGSYSGEEVKATTTIDTTARLPVGRIVPGLGLDISVSNIFNVKPPLMRQGITSVQYDTANYTALGRVVAVTLSKKW